MAKHNALSRLFAPAQQISPLAASFRDGCLLTGKSLVTGGTISDRTSIMSLTAAQAVREGRSDVIVLHRRSSRVARAMSADRVGLPIGGGYDPLRDRSPEDGAELLCACADVSGFDGNGMYLLLEDILRHIRDEEGDLSIHDLLEKDARAWHRLLMEDDEHFLDSHVTEKTIGELSRYLAKLRQAFRSRREGISLADPGLVCLDVGESSMAWHLALLELVRLQQELPDICVILEHPPVDEVLLDLADRNWSGTLMICGPDLPAAKDHWSGLSGNLGAMVAFCHENGISCDALAQYFGQCERVRSDANTNVSKTNTAFLTKTYSTGSVHRVVREYSIYPEQIQSLPEGHAAVRIRNYGQAVCMLKSSEGG